MADLVNQLTNNQDEWQCHEAKKKQHAHTYLGLCNHYSELFTRMIGLIFLNAVAQPLLQLSLSLLQT